eukprot:Em0019g209a
MTARIVAAFSYIMFVCSVNGIQFYSKTSNALDLGHTDDNDSGILQLPAYLVFYNKSYSSLVVCNNGMISLQTNSPFRCKTPKNGIPNSHQTLIGPFISDVDTRPPNSGKVYYELSTSPSLLARAREDITLTYRDETFNPTLLIIATYDHVGYYPQNTDKLNTYQVVLATNGATSYALFLYNAIEWTRSTSGSANVGFNEGDGIRWFVTPITNLATLPQTSNVNVPGLYVYRIDGTEIPAAPASILYPYGVAAGDASLPPADASSVLVALQQSINLYGSSVSSVYVSHICITGGSVSNPTGFPTANGLFIAPFWANVDTTCAGKVYYRETNDSTLLQRALAEIRRGYAADSFSPARLLVVTWAQVGYYNCQLDKTNTFQAIIASGGGTSYVLFIYDAMQWMNGDSSGVGQTGISAGDGTNYFSLDGSGTSSVLSLPIQSNVAKSGLFVFAGTAKLYPFGVSQSDTAGTSDFSPSVSFSFRHHNLLSNLCYVYKNGYISFDKGFGSSPVPYSLQDYTVPADVVIAPYWSDTSTAVGGAYYYRTTTSESLLQRVSAEIQSLFGVKFRATNLLIATWNKMAYRYRLSYDGSVNTFQAVVATDGIISYLIYLYDTLQWHRSSFITNKMSSPQVGFAIDGTVLTMPQSGSSDALSLTYSSNKHVPGMTLYAVPANPLAYFRVWFPHGKGHSTNMKHIHHKLGGAKANVKAEKGRHPGRKGELATSLKRKPFHIRKFATTRAKLPMLSWASE